MKCQINFSFIRQRNAEWSVVCCSVIWFCHLCLLTWKLTCIWLECHWATDDWCEQAEKNSKHWRCCRRLNEMFSSWVSSLLFLGFQCKAAVFYHWQQGRFSGIQFLKLLNCLTNSSGIPALILTFILALNVRHAQTRPSTKIKTCNHQNQNDQNDT